MWLYDATVNLVVIGVPLFCYALKGQAEWKTRLLELAGGAVLFVSLILFSKWDPQSVIEWFWD